MRNSTELEESLQTAWSMPLELGIRLIPGHCQHYAIEMLNHYLDRKGQVARRQKLVSTFSRKIVRVLSEITALTVCRWESVSFQTASRKEPWTEPIQWTFATGLEFNNYLFYANQPGHAQILLDYHHTVIDHYRDFYTAYQSLPKLPSVYLLIMQTLDIVAFEMFTSFVHSTPELVRKPGRPVELKHLTNLQSAIGFGFYADSSLFKNGVFYGTFLGYGIHRGETCAIFEYECEGARVQVSEKNQRLNAGRVGHSYYAGLLYLNLGTGLPVLGTMRESYVGVQKSQSMGLPEIPVHVRRHVKLELAGDQAAGI